MLLKRDVIIMLSAVILAPILGYLLPKYSPLVAWLETYMSYKWLLTISIILFVLCSTLAYTISRRIRFNKKPNSTYKLLCQFEGLVNIVKPFDIKNLKYPITRYKPWFNNYNSCIKELENLYKEEFQGLSLEPLPVYGKDGKEQFTADKSQTLLHQSEAIVALLKGLLPPEYKKLEG